MARTNKYASLNFNDIYEKNTTTKNQNPPSLTSPNNKTKTKTILSNSRIHGNMLVLTKPSPPLPQHHPQSPPVRSTGFEPDSISLRPLGRTGTGSAPTIPITSPVQVKERGLSVSPKPQKFVPPHLRPGFLGREEKPVQLGGNRQGPVGSPNRVWEDERPKSGGGYERVKRGGESDRVEMRRPGSSGSRPSSSGLCLLAEYKQYEYMGSCEKRPKIAWKHLKFLKIFHGDKLLPKDEDEALLRALMNHLLENY